MTRILLGFVLIGGMLLVTDGCEPKPPPKYYDGPTVDSFSGQLTKDGKPATFPDDEEVVLRLTTDKGKSFGVPIKSDGSFSMGWMPIGKMSARLERDWRDPKKMTGLPKGSGVPGMTIEAGKTSGYVIEISGGGGGGRKGKGKGGKDKQAAPKSEPVSGQLVQDGKPVTFPEGEEIILTLTGWEEAAGKMKAISVPVKPDGTFKVEGIQAGKVNAILERQDKDPAKQTNSLRTYIIPGGLTIETGKAAYTIDLGKNVEWKPVAPGYYSGPKVDTFSGQLVQDGKPVTFPEDEEVVLRVMGAEESPAAGKTFGVPIKSDGSYSVGWMPLGKMTLRLERQAKVPAKDNAPPKLYTIPGGLTIEKGKTSDYKIELGKDWKR